MPVLPSREIPEAEPSQEGENLQTPDFHFHSSLTPVQVSGDAAVTPTHAEAAMVKVGLKKAHTLTGISRGGGALTGAASRKAAGKKLKSAQGAAGRLTLAAKRRVPFTGVSKKAGGIKRAPRATVSTAARVAAGMWAHDKFEADGGAEGGEEYWDEEEEEEEEEEEPRLACSGGASRAARPAPRAHGWP